MIRIQVVGPGCANCRKLAALCEEVVSENGIEAEVGKVTDITRFIDLGVMITPGLVIDGVVKSAGKMPVKATLTRWIVEAAALESPE